MPLDLVFMGPPGAGKGTQAARVAPKHGLAHIATGDMLRAAVRDGTALGLVAKDIMARGDLVPDDVIIGMIRDRLAQPDGQNGCVLDGFPRTLAQAQALDTMLEQLDQRIAAVPVFDLPQDELVARIAGRRVCRSAEHVYHLVSKPPRQPGVCDIDGSELYQREDDREEVIRARYQKQWVEAAKPVLDYYDEGGLVVFIDASGTPEQVSAQLDDLFERLEARS
jgi:adenylate kinase